MSPHRKNRGVPPPASFDIDTLPGGAHLTPRRTPGALEQWRRISDHPSKWAYVDGRPLYRVDSVRHYLTLDIRKKKRPAGERG